MTRRVLVCGGRDFADRGALHLALDRLHASLGFSVVIAGGARGADTLAAEWAGERGIPIEILRTYSFSGEGVSPNGSATDELEMIASGSSGATVTRDPFLLGRSHP